MILRKTKYNDKKLHAHNKIKILLQSYPPSYSWFVRKEFCAKRKKRKNFLSLR